MKLINTTINTTLLNENGYDMKGNFRRIEDVDASLTESELDRVLGHIYKNERTVQSQKQNMRIRWNRGSQPIIAWYDERPGGSGHYSWGTVLNHIEGHLRVWTGRDFNRCLAELKRKFFSNKDWQKQASGLGGRKKNVNFLWRAFREHFMFEFEPWGDYSIDDQNRIVYHKPARKRSNKICVYIKGEKVVFERGSKEWLKYRAERRRKQKKQDTWEFWARALWAARHHEKYGCSYMYLLYNDPPELNN